MRIVPVPALLLVLALAVAVTPARASGEAAGDSPADTIERGAQLVIDGLRAFFSSIPHYEAPEILPNGDIIIRRVRPDAERSQPDEAEEDDRGLKL